MRSSEAGAVTEFVSCAHCRFWQAQGGSLGLCRRQAPRSHLIGIGNELEVRAAWPATSEVDWCGQFAADPSSTP